MKLFLQYPKCGTCRKAAKWLNENNITVESRDITIQNPTIPALETWLSESNLPIRKFFNTSGLKYKELNLKDKIKTLSDKEMIELLASDGKLVKRPILVCDKFVLIGFNEDEWNEKLLQ